jgi:hypothetical protein
VSEHKDTVGERQAIALGLWSEICLFEGIIQFRNAGKQALNNASVRIVCEFCSPIVRYLVVSAGRAQRAAHNPPFCKQDIRCISQILFVAEHFNQFVWKWGYFGLHKRR